MENVRRNEFYERMKYQQNSNEVEDLLRRIEESQKRTQDTRKRIEAKSKARKEKRKRAIRRMGAVALVALIGTGGTIVKLQDMIHKHTIKEYEEAISNYNGPYKDRYAQLGIEIMESFEEGGSANLINVANEAEQLEKLVTESRINKAVRDEYGDNVEIVTNKWEENDVGGGIQDIATVKVEQAINGEKRKKVFVHERGIFEINNNMSRDVYKEIKAASKVNRPIKVNPYRLLRKLTRDMNDKKNKIRIDPKGNMVKDDGFDR